MSTFNIYFSAKPSKKDDEFILSEKLEALYSVIDRGVKDPYLESKIWDRIAVLEDRILKLAS